MLINRDSENLHYKLENIMTIIDIVNTKSKNIQDNLFVFYTDLEKQNQQLKDKMDKSLPEMVENKIHVALEKIQKDNQETWESTLKHVNTNFKDAGGNHSLLITHKL